MVLERPWMPAPMPPARDLFAEPPAHGTSLNRLVGPDRTLALIRSDIDLVKQVAHTHGAKVNDVLLAVTAGGLRALLHSRGETVDDLVVPVYVPVTLRHGQFSQARGNLIGHMVVPLPIGVSDPSHRLRQIAAETVTRKAGNHPSLGVLLRSRIARWVLLKVLDLHPVNITTADVPGPQQPLTSPEHGCFEVFPMLPDELQALVGQVAHVPRAVAGR
jgi:hypothetical protein